MSELFSGAMPRWPICEKEAFSTANYMAQTDHYTACAEAGIYANNRNLIFIFDLLKSHPNMPAYLVSKIQGWALILPQFLYVVSHIPGGT